ncbi:hypothetical protein HMPREF1221_00071 [Treponema socranskii subsp. paredis ATCC 35535]|nr:hypothetical protein HMPREF1221_00071 [Treponema socranskii subsp. paredis ATCC 35535]
MQERKNPSNAQDFFAYSIKEKRVKRFSTPDFINQIRAVRDLQRARSAKFPAQELCASPMKEKRRRRFSPFDFIKRFRAMRRNRERIDKRKTARPFFAARFTGANPNCGNY